VSDLADRTILFHRDFGGLTGGHLKVWDYYRHATHSRRYRPRIYLTPESVRDAGNPWLSGPSPPLTAWRPAAADVLFLAGLDWEAVPEPVAMPVINLVQGVRHADRGDPRRAFLVRPAIRICVSDEVADAIGGTGLVNGPVHVIPNGIDLDDLPPPAAVRDTPVLVAGAKNPAFATAVAERLGVAGVRADCLLAGLPRPAFLARLARAQVAVTLPLDREGFFLPALEAMAVGASVAAAGLIGFVGIVVPHAVRLLAGASYRRLLPLTLIVGAAFLILADIPGRVLQDPAETPIGVVTAFLGAPFFIVVLRTRKVTA
jgi:hypothetical protein